MITGIGVTEGRVVAPAFLWLRKNIQLTRQPVNNIPKELDRFQQTLANASKELTELKQQLQVKTNDETARIFDFHLQMLKDKQLLKAIEEKIIKDKCKLEYALSETFDSWIEQFRNLSNPLIQARAKDIEDVKNRLLNILTGNNLIFTLETASAVILVAEDLTPSETATLDKSKIAGIATCSGGKTSHSAIIARMLGIPAVVGLGEVILQVKNGTLLAVDGSEGTVKINPSRETISKYQKHKELLPAREALTIFEARKPTITLDGRKIKMMANIGKVEEAKEALKFGAEGVGLLRSEFLYLQRTALPSEEEQFQAYRKIARVLGKKPLIIRTLDIGGDKQASYLNLPMEANPYLGVRAVRLSLRHPEIFLTQAKAIFRAGLKHNLKIMLPMITTLEEVRQVKKLLMEVKIVLNKGSVPYAGEIDLGIMIETPASALMADVLSQEVDFFSIGSNDLTQYTLAVDRGNQSVNYLYQELEPAVLRLINQVVEQAHLKSIWVGLCGELAANLQALPLLVGMGLDEFSMTPRVIPQAKTIIRKLKFEKSRELAREALKMTSANEVKELVTDFLKTLR